MTNAELQAHVLQSIVNQIKDRMGRKAREQGLQITNSEELRRMMKSMDEQSFQALKNHIVIFLLKDCFDPILYPTPIKEPVPEVVADFDDEELFKQPREQFLGLDVAVADQAEVEGFESDVQAAAQLDSHDATFYDPRLVGKIDDATFNDPELVGKLDVDNHINLLYGLFIAVEQAFLYTWNGLENYSPATENEFKIFFENIKEQLIEDGLFPRAEGIDAWNRNYTAIFTTTTVMRDKSPLADDTITSAAHDTLKRKRPQEVRNTIKRHIVDTSRIMREELPLDKFFEFLIKEIMSEGYSLSFTGNRAKYSLAAKTILHSKFPGLSDYQNQMAKRGLFQAFPMFVKNMKQLMKDHEFEHQGVKYSHDERAERGPVQLARELTKEIFTPSAPTLRAGD